MTTLKMGTPCPARRDCDSNTWLCVHLVFADGHQVLDEIHFIVPGGAGGGWDGTARGTGEALDRGGPRWQLRHMRTCRAAAAVSPSAT